MDPSTLKVWKDFVRLGNFLGLVPYKFVTIRKVQSEDETENCVPSIKTKTWVYDKSVKQRAFVIFSYFLLGLNQMFLLIRTIQIFSTEGVPVKSKIQVFYLVSIFMTVNIFQWVHLNFYGQHCHIYNAIVMTTNHLNMSGKSTRNPNGFLRWTFRFVVFMTFFFAMSRGLAVFKYPEMKFHLTSLASRPKDVSIWVKVFAAAFHFHTTLVTTFFCVFIPTTSMWYISAVIPIIKESRLTHVTEKPRAKTNTTQSKKRKTELQLYHEYHCLKVLQSKFDAIYRLVPVASELVVLNVAVSNLFLAVVFKDYKSLVKAVGTMAFQFSAIKQMALVHEESTSAIESWKRAGGGAERGEAWQKYGRNGWFSKFTRSCKSVKVSVGGFFFVDRAFILTLLSIIVQQTANLILSYN